MPPSLERLRSPGPADEAALLALNNDNARELSPLTLAELRDLIAKAYRVRVADDAAAMLVAFDQDSAYRGWNFLWFRERYKHFVYIDRVVVSSAARGRGLGRALYEDIVEAARRSGHALLCCEVNLDPPNPVSDKFHAALGFAEVGQGRHAAYDKTVRYLTRPV
jgi:predicted GNAT superfamily acetyltransferase